ncbi:MAG: AAA family ATPase [Candidatus Thorarchaeota archaeon]
MGGILKRTSLDQIHSLSDNVRSQLVNIGITTAELLAHSVPEFISSRIGISKEQSLKIIRLAKQAIGISGFKTSFEMKEKNVPLLRTGFDCIEKALGGGFRSESIVEIQGQQWAGKTLMCSHLAIQAQLVETDNGSAPKVIWYDTDQSYRKKRIMEIAYRYRMDPKIALKNVIMVDVKKRGFLEPNFESVRNVLAKHHVSLVILDSLGSALKHQENRSMSSGILANISRISRPTGLIFVLTNRLRYGFSRSMFHEYKRSGSQSAMIDYALHLHLIEEGERNVVSTDYHDNLHTECKLHIGNGGFFGNRTSRNKETIRVQRYLNSSSL